MPDQTPDQTPDTPPGQTPDTPPGQLQALGPGARRAEPFVANEARQHILADLASHLDERLTAAGHGERLALALPLLQNLYAHCAIDDLRAIDTENLVGAALALLRLGQRRKKGEHKIRVYNPDPDEDGWSSSHTVIEIINDDMPFLVDSITGELNRHDITVHLVLHPILDVARDDDGVLTDIHAAAAGAPKNAPGLRESFMHIELDEQPADTLAGLRDDIARILDDVRLAVEDWPSLMERVDDVIGGLKKTSATINSDVISKEAVDETCDFLEWLKGDHFTFLGYRRYDLLRDNDKDYLRYVEDSGLGVLRHLSEESKHRHATPLSPAVAQFARRAEPLILTKAYDRSTVHRNAYMDYVGVRIFDESGAVIGEHRFVGLFTSTAYSRSPRYIPLLSGKVQRTIDRAGFDPKSHDGKALLHILETFPRDELFQIGEDTLQEIALGILQLQERQRTALFVRVDPFERFVSALVYVPRERFNATLRQRFRQILEEAFGGTQTTANTHVGDEPLARLHYVVRTRPERIPDFSVKEIEARLIEAGRSWSDRLREVLVQEKGEEAGLGLWRRFGDSFPPGYVAHFDARSAIADIGRIEEALAGLPLGIHLYRRAEDDDAVLHLKIYHRGQPIPLSDILPVLENMGLRVISKMPFPVAAGVDGGNDGAGGKEGDQIWIHDFEMRRHGDRADTATAAPFDLGAIRPAFQDLLARVWDGTVEDDRFNRLVLFPGFDWRAIVVLRAYCKYLRQTRMPFSETYVQETLSRNPRLALSLIRLFKTRFDFEDRHHAESQMVRLTVEIEEMLEQVSSLDEDRILRRYLNLIGATLRTNFYQKSAEGGPKPYLSFKFASAKVTDLPLPRPMFEIFVYAPRFEAVHLRGGKVARGGIRWSDRREDFRTEILGLMKAQMVKNAVIVPVGAKGGFVVKRPPAKGGREALMEEVIACYKSMMSGMLDLTDNLVQGEVQAPPRVVRYDEDDPYLVVAADKGTASFSDIANGIALEYGHWMGDAYASGGSVGYDHKRMGITARGAWESVKRHFRELSTDIQSEDFTVVGIGDMSGDVFGNGMLLSRHIRLLGAFNHLHVFIDPSPDAAASFAERQRLFDLPRSSWSDYDPALISKGGGVFDRKAKSIPLSAEVKSLFGLKGETCTPNELIRALLMAKVDLLWFGGIGTYVKGTAESDSEAGDRANDPVRVNGADLRAKVVGEGANLGVTQRGRIEYALAGGRLNTDAIDNSAGVDCSDHEVNIKIALNQVMEAGDLTEKQRNILLAEMTNEVAALVLRDNYLQTQAITVDAAAMPASLDRHTALIRALEREGRLNRGLEFLPDDETLSERANTGVGLTRPELSVLLAYAKLSLFDKLLPSSLPDDPLLEQDLLRYFPVPLTESNAKALFDHRLRREIIATSVTNSMVNRVGATFVNDMTDATGLAADEVARAYAVTRDVFDLRRLWGEIEALDNAVPAVIQTEMMVDTRRLISRTTRWFLNYCPHPIDMTMVTSRFRPGVADLASSLDGLITGAPQKRYRERIATLTQAGVPDALARDMATLGQLAAACDIVNIASSSGQDRETDREKEPSVAEIARLYFAIGAEFGFDALRQAALSLDAGGLWEKQAREAILEDLYVYHGKLTAEIAATPSRQEDKDWIAPWIDAHRHKVDRVLRMIDDLDNAARIDLAMLAVVSRQLRALVTGA